jgi:class 3 adenylate cyclase
MAQVVALHGAAGRVLEHALLEQREPHATADPAARSRAQSPEQRDQAGSESVAARACIEAMRGIRHAADRSGLEAAEVTMRFGLHWGATLYVGRLMTSGRAEVTALGEEVNEAARIEACATGGRALASKALAERLQPADAAALGIDPERLSYTSLAGFANRDREGAPRRARACGLRGLRTKLRCRRRPAGRRG